MSYRIKLWHAVCANVQPTAISNISLTPYVLIDLESIMSISKEFVDWINDLPQSERDRIVEKIHLVQSWVDEFADALGKKKPPAVRITEKNLYYAPLSNHLCVPTRLLMELDDPLLRIVVAHECGHYNRRWVSLLAWTPMARP